jgi:hypothetical protein
MNNSITETIANTIKRLGVLSDIASREPAFALWHFSGHAAADLVQLFPANRESPVADRQAQAKAIARAFGGKWSRDAHDGSWRNEGAEFRVILHYVDSQGRVAIDVDISEPVAAPVSVEEQAAPMAEPCEVREEEHHLAAD